MERTENAGVISNQKPIRVLQVLPRLLRGGSQTMVMNIYRAIDRSKIQFDFIIFTQNHGDFYDEIKSLGGRVYHLHKFNGKNMPVIIREWNAFFKAHPEYKIMHSHVRSFASIYIPIAKKYGVKTIIHSHSTSNPKNFSGLVKTIMEYPLRYQADYLFACSREAGEWLYGKKSTSKGNYYFMPNAVNLSDFSYSQEDRLRIRDELGIDNKFVVGHVGGFEVPKNHSFLLKVFAELHERNPETVLLLVGDGTLEQDVREQCAELRLSGSVIFTGLQANVAPYLSAMDVFVFPSLWEGLPVSVVEAQANGLQCYVSDKVTGDVNLSELVHYLPIDRGTGKWTSAISDCESGRTDVMGELAEKGYDSKTCADRLADFYGGILGEQIHNQA